MKVKICGITNLEDARAAIDFGADAIGLVFASDSPRFVSKEYAAEIIQRLPSFVTTVGVFTSMDEEEIAEVVAQCGIDRVQFHAAFPARTVQRFSQRAIQVIRVKDENSFKDMGEIPVRAFLLDTYHEKMAGGSGISFNWAIAGKAKFPGQIILAGGLRPENIQEAIRKVRPYGVDVSSGVEAEKGKKDHAKMKKFIRLAKEMEGMGAASQ